MSIQCAKCYSDNVTVHSRQKFLLRSAVCAFILLLSLLITGSLFDEDLDFIVLGGFIICGIVSVAALVLAIIYLLKGLRVKETSYKCEFCLHKFSTPLIVNPHPYAHLLKTIRKRVSKQG